VRVVRLDRVADYILPYFICIHIYIIMTSGATLAEIAGVLKRAGVARVTNLVALRTPPPQTRYVTASQHGHPHSLKH